MGEVYDESGRQPDRTVLTMHYVGIVGAFLVGIAAATLILDATAEGGDLTTWGMGIAVGVLVANVHAGSYLFYRAVGEIVPASTLGLVRPQTLERDRRWDFARAVVRGNPDEIAGYLDDLRGLDSPGVRPWQPAADVRSETGQAAYRDAQELRESIQGRFRIRMGLAAVAIVLGLAAMWFMAVPIERSVGPAWMTMVFPAVMVGPPTAIVSSLFPRIVRDWTLWYRDHVPGA